MKKVLTLLLTLALLLSCVPVASADSGITVTVDGRPVQWTDAEPFIDENGRTLVPLRAVGDALGLSVDWNPDTRTASFTDGGKSIYFPVGGSVAYTTDGTVTMDTAAVIVNGRTYAPIRYLADYFGYSVGWNEETKSVQLNRQSTDKAEKFYQLAQIIKANGTQEVTGYTYAYATLDNITYEAAYSEVGDDIKRISLSIEGGGTRESLSFENNLQGPYRGLDIRPSNSATPANGIPEYYTANFEIDPATYTQDTVLKIKSSTYPEVLHSSVEGQFNVGVKLILSVAYLYLLAPNELTLTDIGFSSYNVSTDTSAKNKVFETLKSMIISNGDAASYGYMYIYAHSDGFAHTINYYTEYDKITFAVHSDTYKDSYGFAISNDLSSPYTGVQLHTIDSTNYQSLFVLYPETYTGNTTLTIDITQIPTQEDRDKVDAALTSAVNIILLSANLYILRPNGLTYSDLGFTSFSSDFATSETKDVTLGQQNALAKAKQYLSIAAFSRSGLIKQLEYEGYTHSEAEYGADNCGSDWFDQAAKKAAEYLSITAFSRQGLIEQLEYEGFTHAQAVYGVGQVGY